MQINVKSSIDATELHADSLLVFHTEGKELPESLKALDAALGGELAAMLADEELTGKANAVAHVRTNGRIAAKHLYLCGLGATDKLDAEIVRKAAGTAARSLQGEAAAVVLFAADYAEATVEGLILGGYTYQGHKSEPAEKDKKKKLQTLTVVGQGDVTAAVKSGEINAQVTNDARDLGERPANLLDPVMFADHARRVGEAAGLGVEILDENQLKELGLNLLLEVGKGSDIPPRMVVLRHNGAPESKDVLGLVGKGVTYDTGGYIIKPEDGMAEMKTDMMGAACVLGAMAALARKNVAVNAIGVLAIAENMISGRAFKPGDVAVAFNGKTVEMIDTDCEGRLVLADGVAYVKHLGATRIVDTATLTGAVLVALGREAASLLGNNDEWTEQVKSAGQSVGERLFPLPNYPEYQQLIESEIADYINYSGRNGSAIAGGVFITAFADEVPFVHIDMANMAMAKKTKGYMAAASTGFSTRTLIAVAEALAK